ncbi:MAG: RagB/SusD family nutrient uptake outer membrane protein [Prevotellaceae bacterium]|nr:RagB/SusD family nutrient uptake outer membrane protein [Prevotellaceae bacterium]
MTRYIHYISLIILLAGTLASCDNFLDRDPQDKLTNESYWIDETSLRTYAQDFYSSFFIGYDRDYTTFGGYFSGDNLTDDFLTLAGGTRVFPTSSTTGLNATTSTWSSPYGIIYKANVMIEKIADMNISAEAKEHWTGVARYFRAMAYSSLLKIYGGVPYIDRSIDPFKADDYALLYKDRDTYLYCAQQVLADYRYAIQYMRANDTKRQVNKYVAGAYMSRDMLYHATWLKYHGTNIGPGSQPVPDADLKDLFQGAVEGAETVMNSGNYAIGNTYNALFSTDDLAGNKEIIFYREYSATLQNATNALMSYNASENQDMGGVTENVIESYLCSDGLPIGQSPLYQGATDKRIAATFQNRDPRLYETVVDSLRILNSGLFPIAASPTGYPTKKFLNEEWYAAGNPYTTNRLSPADAPTIRYAEVLLNYVEARYEISRIGGSAFTQSDLDKSINLLRGRHLTKWGETPEVTRTMPTVMLNGANLSSNGVVIDDPERDVTVDAILWEIRRERRVELIMEGMRGADLKRWAKYEYLNSEMPDGSISKTFLGAYIKAADYPGIDISEKAVKLYNPADPTNLTASEGYIRYFTQTGIRVFTAGSLDSERYYLRSIPAGQITNYKDAGYTLTQNPGW